MHIINKLNYKFLKKLLGTLMISLLSSPATFAFVIENENSVGGKDDFVFVQIARMGYGDIADDHHCLSNGNANVYGTILFSSDLPYGASLDLSQNPDQSGNATRLCMSVKYGKSHFKAAFDDRTGCIMKFHFRDGYGYINDYGKLGEKGLGLCDLAYEYRY